MAGATLGALIAICAPHVHPATMLGLVAVESAGNPFAVSINRPVAAARRGYVLPAFPQPRSREEARRLVDRLHAAGFTTSVGLAQINAENLAGWQIGVDALLDPCTNLRMAERVLLACDKLAAGHRPSLPALLACFNTGSASTGLSVSYAQRVRNAAIRLTRHSPTRSFVP
jgi:type IV secretion system protein VirB1